MNLVIGVLLAILAAVINGNFALPLKCARKWSWENSWGVYSLVAFLILPFALAFFTNPGLAKTVHTVSRTDLLVPLLFGAGWGISQVLLGISVSRVGMALTFAIVIGLSAIFGTLVPLIGLHREFLVSLKGAVVLLGLVIMVGGISLCAKAGRERERIQMSSSAHTLSARYSYGPALAITIAAGVLTPMLNYALAFGEPILKRAVALGATPANATYSVWLIALLGGMPVNLLYCAYLLNRNHSWATFAERSYDWVYAVLMGIMWMSSIALYGIATTHLGPSGAAIGWGLFSIFVILAANLSGLITGEWRNVGRRPVRTLGSGLALLTVASILIAWGNR